MPLSNSVLRRYTPPTCTLEVAAKSSPLSRWVGRSVLKDLHFELRFDDPRKPEDQRVTIRGDAGELETLCDAVNRYVQEFVDLSPGQLPLALQTLTSATDSIPNEERLRDGMSYSASDVKPLKSMYTQAFEAEPDVSGDLSSARRAESEVKLRTLQPRNLPTEIYLQPRGLLTHELFLGRLATEESGPVVDLSVIQLFDLATALDEYAAEGVALPNHRTPRRSKKGLPTWTPTAAAVLLAVGVTTAVLKLPNKPNTGQQAAAPTASPTNLTAQAPPTSQVPLPPTTPLPSPLPTPVLPPSLSTLPTLPPPSPVPVLPPPTRPVSPVSPSQTITINPSPLAKIPTSPAKPTPALVLSKIPSVPTPTGSSRTPTGSISTPTGSSRTPTGSISTPTGSSRTPTGSSRGDSPSSSTKTPTRPSTPSPTPTPPPLPSNFPPLKPTPSPSTDNIADQTVPTPTGSSPSPSPNSNPSESSPADNASNSRQSDIIPQVAEVRNYLQARWKAPSGLTQTLEYQMVLNPDGSIQRITPLGQAAIEYMDRIGIPSLGESFVSPVEGGRNAKIRLVLSPDDKVQTFLEK